MAQGWQIAWPDTWRNTLGPEGNRRCTAEVYEVIAMNKLERDDLRRLIQQRARVLKSAAKQRSAELLAEFEKEMASEYAFDDDAVWQEATRAVEQVIRKANLQIAARCRELRIPEAFAPTLGLEWRHRGGDSLVERRKAELRKTATARIEATKAIVEIEMHALHAQTEIAASALTSAAGQSFIAQLPTVEDLMPRLIYSEVSGGRAADHRAIDQPECTSATTVSRAPSGVT